MIKGYDNTAAEQTDVPLARKRFTDVYIAPLPDRIGALPLFPKEREDELFGIANEKVKREKYYVWRLLEYAAVNSLGVSMDRLAPKKGSSGRWTSPICDFSLSHGGGAVAVAISSHRVGVDIEELCAPRHARLAERTLTSGELAEYRTLSDADREGYLITAWSGKEAVFKSREESAFVPSSIDASALRSADSSANEYTLISNCLIIYRKKCVLSLFHRAKNKLRVFKDVDLKVGEKYGKI